jgi:hypothetical protein
MRFRIPILTGILVIVENFSVQVFFDETAFVILKGKKESLWEDFTQKVRF